MFFGGALPPGDLNPARPPVRRYDSSRADVVAAYPNGSVYADKMAGWTSAIHAAFPAAKVALIGVRWNSYRKEREDTWNKQVLQSPVSAGADAATLHIYCPWDESNNASDPADMASHLAQAFFRVAQNKAHVAATVPARLRVWVTEMGVYGNFDTIVGPRFSRSIGLLPPWRMPRVV